jgi:two-component system, LytTR family, response regulator
MPEVDGFGVVEAVGLERLPATIFVTAYEEYAIRAFDAHAVDYLLKPVDGERFHTALARARARLAAGSDPLGDGIPAVLAALRGRALRRYAQRLAIRSSDRISLLEVGEVDWLRAADNYVEVHIGGRVKLLRETLTHLEARLDPERFVRVSRSAIVNADRVRELRSPFAGDCLVVLRDGTQVAASRRYRPRLTALYE